MCRDCMPMSFYLGVDGGNTKTIAVVAHADGTIAGWGRGGCGDIYGAGSDAAALAELERAVNTALDQASARPDQLAAAAYSVAGADWPEDFEVFRAAMQERGFGRRVAIYNDAIGALWAGAPHGPAVVVVCGTGVATGSRGADGKLWHTSHWQEPHGSIQLTGKTLRAICRADLGIDPPTSLTARALAHFGVETVEQVLYLFSRRRTSPPPHARGLARILLDEAGAGDPTARRMVREHGRTLGDYALAAARKVDIDRLPFTLVLTGGMFRHQSTLLPDALVERVRETSPNVHVVQSTFEPALGALLLAFDLARIPLDDPLIQRVAATAPPLAFFET